MKYYTGKHVDLNSYSKRSFDWQKVWEFCQKPAAMIVATAIIITGILGFTFKKAFSYRHVEIGDLSNEDLGITVDLPEGITNIALFGIDSRNSKGFSGNSDSIMILSINSETATVKLTSVMRDSLVEIDGYRTTKINAAYARGGAALAIKTLNQNFNLNITEYATVNFSGMAEIIDAIGGVTVDVSAKEMQNANTHIRWLCHVQGTTPHYIEKTGVQKLDGMQAVAFSRIRYYKFAETGTTDDFGRTDRQRYVMEQLLNTVLSMSKTQYPNLIKTCLPFVETSLSYKEILSFAGLLTSDLKFEQSRIPDARYVINAGFKLANGGSSVYYNLDFATDVLHAFIYENIDTDTYLSTHKPNLTGWYGGQSSFVTNTSSKEQTVSSNVSGTSSSGGVVDTPSKEQTASDITSSEESVSSDEGTQNVSSDETVTSSDISNTSSENTVSSEEQSPSSSEPANVDPPVSSEPEQSVSSAPAEPPVSSAPSGNTSSVTE